MSDEKSAGGEARSGFGGWKKPDPSPKVVAVRKPPLKAVRTAQPRHVYAYVCKQCDFGTITRAAPADATARARVSRYPPSVPEP